MKLKMMINHLRKKRKLRFLRHYDLLANSWHCFLVEFYSKIPSFYKSLIKLYASYSNELVYRVTKVVFQVTKISNELKKC